MLNYYDAWCRMDYWRLKDGLVILSTYGALSEGHETPENYLVAARCSYDKCKSYLEKDIRADKFPGKIEWLPIDECNFRDFPIDKDGCPIEQIDYFASTVTKEDFIKWALNKKLPVPEEFSKLVKNIIEENSDGEDKKITTFIKASVHAGYLCENYGSKIKKEDLYEKVNKLVEISLPKFDMIWEQIPDKYKLGQGNPPKAVARAIRAAVCSAIEIQELDKNDLHDSLKNILKKRKLENIENEHFEIIKKELKENM